MIVQLQHWRHMAWFKKLRWRPYYLSFTSYFFDFVSSADACCSINWKPILLEIPEKCSFNYLDWSKLLLQLMARLVYSIWRGYLIERFFGSRSKWSVATHFFDYSVIVGRQLHFSLVPTMALFRSFPLESHFCIRFYLSYKYDNCYAIIRLVLFLKSRASYLCYDSSADRARLRSALAVFQMSVKVREVRDYSTRYVVAEVW